MSDSSKKHDIHELVEARHHRAEIIFGVAAFAAGLFLVTQLGSQLTWKSGQQFVRQPGFFTTISIIGMLGFGALELYFSWKRNASGRGESIASEVWDWLKTVEFAAWFMVYVLAVPNLGYLPATLVFCLLLTLRLGYRHVRFMIAALLVAAATVIIFKSFLSVKIPGGAIYEYLPDAIRNFLILYF